MKSFKTFVKEKKVKPAAVIIDFGLRGGKPIKNFNHIPAATIIDFDRKKPLKESFDDSPWFSHHNENSDYGTTPRDQSEELHKWQTNDKLGEHLKAYSRYSADLNRSLLDAHNKGREHPKSFEDDLHHFKLNDLDKEVNEHKLEHPLHTFSGVGFDPQELASKHPEGHIHLPAYTSTSVDKDVAREFASTARYGQPDNKRHIIHFELPKGQAGKHVGKNSENPFEREFVLPRNTTIKVHPNPVEHRRIGQTYLVHKATIVPKDE